MKGTNILVTGANGQLGNEFRDLAEKYPHYNFVFASRNELPVDSRNAVNAFFDAHKFHYCINCAAYTAVDKAESDLIQATRINSDAVGFLAGACEKNDAVLIHISTDYVFDGEQSKPYKETDRTNPINTYGKTKLLGEQLALRENERTIVIRTSWVYSTHGNNFVKTMVRLMLERETMNVVNDQIGSPTYAADLAEAVMKIIDSGKIGTNAIYHYSNEGEISWYDFALAIKDLTCSSCKVIPIPTIQYPTPAKRPRFSLLDKSKIHSTFNLEIPQWRESLERCIARLKKPG